jgi:hypothetical protein
MKSKSRSSTRTASQSVELTAQPTTPPSCAGFANPGGDASTVGSVEQAIGPARAASVAAYVAPLHQQAVAIVASRLGPHAPK